MIEMLFYPAELIIIASVQTIEESITIAQTMMVWDHVWEINRWCNKYHGHKSVLCIEKIDKK